QDYSGMHFSFSNGDEMNWENSTAKEMLKGVSTFRVGAEFKVVPEFALRLGYNYSSTAFKDNAYKDLSPNSINTDTDFANAKSQSNYTLGIGYRISSFYADLAYLYSTYDDDFYAFNDAALNRTKVTNTRSKVLLTLGLRF
ncbi:MAG TPA: TonB-dependent receptor, partial [Bacteroides reticulotermitis]|nr:TonB-dependent receptor [Bacteroides reticulotermitis]